MHIIPFLAFVFTHLVLSVTAAESSSGSFNKICESISTLARCKTTIPIPEVTVVNGKINWVKWNSCKSRIHYFGGWTCFGGYDKTQVVGPIGVKVSIGKFAICDIARKAIPNYEEIMKRAGGMCKCIPPALDGLDDPATRAVFTSGNVGAGSAKVLQKYYALQSCYTDAAMGVKDNKAGLTQGQGQLVTKPGVMIFRAAELDTSRYAAFATALAPCFVGACSTDAIIGFFTNYLSDSEAAIKGQMDGLFKPWTSAATSLENAFDQMGNVTRGIGGRIDQVEKDVKTLLNDFCNTPAVCANNTLVAFKEQVESTLNIAKQIAQLDAMVTSAQKSARAIGTVISAGSKAMDAVSDLGVEGILKKVQDGSFRKLEDLAGALKAAQHMPQIIKDIQQQGGQFETIVAELQAKGPQFVDSVQKIVGQNWLSDYKKADAAAAQRLTKQVQQVQALVEGLVPQATQLWTSATFLVNSLRSVSAKRDLDVQLDLGVASYQRSTSGWFHMPCLTTGKKPYNLFGFKGTLDYPKFYRCRQDYNIPFPNQHIPYIRLRMPDDSLLARLGGNLPAGPTTSISKVSAEAQAATAAVASVTSTTGSSSQSTSASPSSTSQSASGSVTLNSSTASESAPLSTASVESTSSASPTAVPSTSPSILPSSTSAIPISTESAAPASRTIAPTQESNPVSAPTAAPARRDRSRPFNMRRQAAEDDTPSVIPAEVPLSADLPAGVFTDEAQASAAERETIPSTILWMSTTVNGQATTVQAPGGPTGAPVSTEILPDSALSQSAISVAATFGVFTDLTTTSLEQDMTTFVPIGTVAVDMSEPTVTPALTTSATTTAIASPTADAGQKSSAERVGCGMWASVLCMVTLGFWLV